MRDRLIEILRAFPTFGGTTLKQTWMPEAVEKLADHLLSEGVIVPPCENPEKVAIVVFSTDGTSHTYYGNMELKDMALAKHEIELDIIDKFISVNADRYNQAKEGE